MLYVRHRQSYTVSKFELWAAIVTLTFDLWPRYFFPHSYLVETVNLWKMNVMWCAISEKPVHKILTLTEWKKANKQTNLYKTKIFFVLKNKKSVVNWKDEKNVIW
jgi:hypothetical protein